MSILSKEINIDFQKLIFERYTLDKIKKHLCEFCIAAAGINDLLRNHFLRNHNSIRYYLSYILSTAICAYLSCQAMNSGTELYNTVLIVEFLIFNKKFSFGLLAVSFFAFALPYKLNADSGNIKSFTNIFMSYSFPFGIIFIMRSLFIERKRAGMLNEELTNANLKLKECVDKIELLTIKEERTKIAQELHDSIGHSLVALNMNLEFAENIALDHPEKTYEVIQKTHTISKECMNKLREAVKMLKEDHNIISLKKEVQINISKQDRWINARIENNGACSREIKKSNGIIGMENRVKNLGGTISFSSTEESGFIIQVNLPSKGTIYEADDHK